MAYTFAVEINAIEKSRAPNGTNVFLEKQILDGVVIVSRSGHAWSCTADPADADRMKETRAQLAALGDMTVGLVPLSPDQIDQIVAVHQGFWSAPPVAPKHDPTARFEDFLAHAIDTQPELADVKAAVADQLAQVAAFQDAAFAPVDEAAPVDDPAPAP